MTVKSSLLHSQCSFPTIFLFLILWKDPQALKGLLLPALSLFFELSFQPGFSNVLYLILFPKPVALYPESRTKFVISPELLILVCECAFSFWFLLLYPQIIFVWRFLCWVPSFFPDSACPCILNDWTLLQVLVWQTSCNDRPLSQYFVTFLSFSLLMLS